MESDLPDRKTPAHRSVIDVGNRSSIIFVTVCSNERKKIFAEGKVHDLLVRGWQASGQWLIGRYIILPDHIHFFCSPGIRDHEPLTRWMSRWKAQVSRDWLGTKCSLWQRSFWDRQLRSGDSYSEKWSYVRNNPVRHGLVTRADEWPYQGELNVLQWHDY